MPERKPSGHRLFTEDDRQVLLAVKALMAEGRSIGEISALGRQALLQRGVPKQSPPGPARTHSRDGDPPQVARFRRDVIQAALRLDSAQLQASLDEAFASLDRETVLERIMVAGIRHIGDLWSRGEASVAHERLASELFCQRIVQWCSAVGRPTRETRALTACLPDERHEMGALLVTYQLLKLGVGVNFLGSLPLLDLELACRELAPSFILLSVTRPEVFEVHRYRLAEAIARMKTSKVILGGEGVRGKEQLVLRMGAFLWDFERPLTELETLLSDVSLKEK